MYKFNDYTIEALNNYDPSSKSEFAICEDKGIKYVVSSNLIISANEYKIPVKKLIPDHKNMVESRSVMRKMNF